MAVIYNSKKLVPAPPFSCSKEYTLADDGSVIGKTYSIVVRGKFVSWMGSPNSSGEFWDQSGNPPDDDFSEQDMLRSQLIKQQAIRKLFSEQGKSFEVQALDGSMSFRCNPRILKIETPEGPLTQLSDYIITMEADTLYVNGEEDVDDFSNSHIVKSSEDWNLEVVDDKLMTYRLTHGVSAVGRVHYDETGSQPKQPWEYAKDYVINEVGLGLDESKMKATGVLDADAMVAYNYVRTQSVNELTGSFAVAETWLCYEGGSATEEFTVNTRTSLEGRTTVSIQGTITGLAEYNNTTRALVRSRIENAATKWDNIKNSLLTRAQTQSGVTLNPVVLTKDVGRNEVIGTITYNYEYDDRPAPLLAGAKSTSITQNDDNACDVFANIPVIGRAAGPILQAIGTVTAKKRTVGLTAQMSVATYSSVAVNEPNSNSLFASYIPSGSQVFIEQDQVSWSPQTGQYARTVTYVYE